MKSIILSIQNIMRYLPPDTTEQAGWVLVHRFLVPNFVVDVRQLGWAPLLELENLHSQQSNEDTIKKEVKSKTFCVVHYSILSICVKCTFIHVSCHFSVTISIFLIVIVLNNHNC